MNLMPEDDNSRIIPLMPGALATIDGKIINRETGEEFRQYMGCYNNYYVTRIEGREHIVHRLIAQAWCDFPMGKTLEEMQVNHKDGVKTNNHASNLEWVTPSENRIHALRTSLAPSKWVQVKNLRTGEIKEYYGINECAKQMDLPQSSVCNYLKDPSKVRKLIYVFIQKGNPWPELTEKDIQLVNRGTTNPFERICKKTDEVVLFSSLQKAAESINKNAEALRRHLKNNGSKPYYGFVFRRCHNLDILEKHQKEYVGHAPSANCRQKPLPIELYDPVTGVVRKWKSAEEMSLSIGIDRNTLRSAISHNGGKLVSGHIVRYTV